MTAAVGSFAELQLESLVTAFPGSELQSLPDGLSLVRVPDLPLPAGWNQSKTTVWFVVPVGFPTANPDCFFADVSLRLASGAMPGASGMQTIPHLGGQHMWFSWHVTGWNAGRDTLLTFVRVIRDRLNRPQ
jgi:hypothetical protein